MCTCAWQFAKLKMSDVSDDSYLYDVAAAAASVVLTVDTTKRIAEEKVHTGATVVYVVGRRSARATCSCPNCEQRTDGCIKFHKSVAS